MHQRTTLTSQYIALFSEGKKIRDKLPTQTHTTSTVHAAFTCDQFVKKKNTALHFINNTVYHITSRPKKQAFLGPITKLVAKLVARHKTSRIQGI